MNIINIPEFNISSFSIGIPNKRNPNGYGSVIKYDGQDTIVQTPICKVEHIDTKDSQNLSLIFKLSKNFEYFQFFCSLHELIIRHLCRYAENNKYLILDDTRGDHEEVRKLFSPNIFKSDTNMYVKLKLNKKTQFFEKNTQEISGLEIKRGDYVICIIKANQISMDDKSANHTWDCIQCLKWSTNET